MNKWDKSSLSILLVPRVGGWRWLPQLHPSFWAPALCSQHTRRRATGCVWSAAGSVPPNLESPEELIKTKQKNNSSYFVQKFNKKMLRFLLQTNLEVSKGTVAVFRQTQRWRGGRLGGELRLSPYWFYAAFCRQSSSRGRWGGRTLTSLRCWTLKKSC